MKYLSQESNYISTRWELSVDLYKNWKDKGKEETIPKVIKTLKT